MPKLGTFPPLKKGRDLQTLRDNSLALMSSGLSKGEAMATSLNLAGLRPAASQASTKSSRKNPPTRQPPV